MSKLAGGTKSAALGFLDFATKVGVAIFAIKEIAGAALGMAGAMLAPNASMEQTRIAFTGLLGSAQAAGAYLKDLWAFAARTPFQFPELVADAQQMMAFGFAAGDVIPMLTDIGDAMSAMGRGSDAVAQVVLVFGQMHAAGKLNAEDMLQLTSTGIPAWKILADSMGLSVAEVQKMTTAGLIPADDAINRLRAGMHATFGGAMQAQSLTFNGLLSTFTDNIQMAWMAFTGPLFEKAKEGLVILGNLVSSPAFQQFATDMGQRVSSALQTVGDVVTTIVIPKLQALAPVAGQIAAYLGPLFVQLGAAVANLAAVLGPLLARFGEWLVQSGTLQGIVTGVVVWIGLLVQGLTLLINTLTNVIIFFSTSGSNAKWLWDILAGIGAFLASVFVPLWQQLVGVWQGQLLPAWNGLVAAIGPAIPFFQLLGQIIGGVLVVALGILVGIIGGVISALAGLIGGLAQALGGVIQIISGLLQIVLGVIGFFVDLFTGHFDRLYADIQRVSSGIFTVFAGLWQTVSGLFVAAFGFLSGLVSGFINSIIGFFTYLYRALVGGSIIPDLVLGIQSWFASLPGRIFGIIAGLVSGTIGQMAGWVGGAIATAASLVSGVIGQIAQLPGRVAGALSGVAGAVMGALSSAASMAWNAGASIVSNIASGILGNIGSFLGNAMGTVGQFISDHLPHSPARLGPLRFLAKQGESIPVQISRGILAGLPEFYTALEALTVPISAGVTPASPYIPSASASRTQIQPQIIVMPPDIVLDGQRLTRAQMPYIVSGIRLVTGARI